MEQGRICFCFIGKDGKVLRENKLTSLPLKEKAIITKSMEFYRDPEPCMIHRSAVMKRLFFELGEFFEGYFQKGEFRLGWDSIPECFKAYLDIKDEVVYVELKYIC